MREIYWRFGPISLLKCGSLWCFEVGRVRMIGIGWRRIATQWLRP